MKCCFSHTCLFSLCFFFFFQRDFYYDTLRAIENGINLKIKQNPLLGDTNIAKDLVTILADS